MVGKRRGVIVSRNVERIPGLDIVIPSGSKARNRAIEIGKQNLKSQHPKPTLVKVNDLARVESQLAKFLKGKELEIKGQYKMERLTLKSNGKKIRIFKKGRKTADSVEVTNISDFSRAIWQAAREAGIIR